MRILVLTNLYPPTVVGGYERLCFDVSSALAAGGHEVTVLTSDYGGRTAEYPGQRVLRELRLLTGANIYSPCMASDAERAAINAGNVRCVTRHIRAVRPDVVFAWNLYFLDAGFLDAVQREARRTVLMLTDNWLLVMRDPGFVAEFFRTVVYGDGAFVAPPVLEGPGARGRGLIRRLLGLGRERGGLEAVFGSRFMRDFYAAGGVRFTGHRVIHNGVRQPAVGAEAGPDRGRLVRPEVLRLLFAGRLVDLKGAHTAVEAMPLLDPVALGVERVELTLLGDMQDAAYRPVLQGAIELSGCASRIDLRPAVAEAALPALFAEHDVYLFPSLYEPFSLTLIHAMASGIPTVASDAGGNGEIVGDGESGLLFPKGNAAALAGCVGRLATDAGLRVRIAAGGRRSASRFTFEGMVGAMSAYLASGLDTPGGGD